MIAAPHTMITIISFFLSLLFIFSYIIRVRRSSQTTLARISNLANS